MSRSRIRVAAAGMTVAVMALAGSGQAAAAGRTKLKHSASPAAARTPSVGSVSGSSRIGFQVDLKLRDAAGAAALARAVSTPSSSQYGHFLTARQWEARYSPSASSVAGVRKFLRRQGFSVGRTSADRMEVSATGTAGRIESAFATRLSLHKVNGQVLRLADIDLSIPSSLSAAIAGLTGVNQTLVQPQHQTGAAEASRPMTQGGSIPQPAGFRVATPCGSYYNASLDTTLPAYGNGYPTTPPWAVCGYTGSQLRSAYGLSGSDTGSGVTVAIIDAYASPTLESDAQTFASRNDASNPLSNSQFSELLPPAYTNQKICSASGWFGEQTLDVEAVHDMAPGAHILYAGAESCMTPDTNAALRQIVDGHLADVVTNSYGDDAGDLLDSASSRQSTDQILEMAAGTGISVLFSSGDNGDEYTTVGQVSPDYPASSPYATAVGGTTLKIGSSGQRLGEFGWSTARSFLCNSSYISSGGCTSSQQNTWLPIDLALDGGSGGGTSYVYQQPWYQAGVVPTSLSEAAGPGGPMRVEPDISLEADPATGMLAGETQTFPDGTYYDQYRIGGTSVASPLFAGLLARAIQTGGHALGLVNPALYAMAGQSTDIRDVGPAGKQIQSRSDYANSIDASQGYLDSTRIIDYQGTEQFCPTKGSKKAPCTQRQVALQAASGYDNMTGLGSPGTGLVGALAATH